jgi:3-methylfumaryl-CoA hydratase
VTPVRVDPFPVAALAALFDDGLAAPGPGDLLPPYWHYAACAVPPPSGVLGPAGHPVAGPAAAPPGLPRRMFAGGRLRLAGDVRVGERLERTERVIASTDKQGRSGPLRFVTVEYRLSRPDGTELLAEEQDIVFRAPAGPGSPQGRPAGPGSPHNPPAGPLSPLGPAAVAAVPGGRLLTRRSGPLRARFLAGPVALQRFSAATSNAHRIHYDHPYVTAVEGYPGLVVHGPLLLLSLLELIRLDRPGREVTGAAFTARSPAFAGEEVELAADADGRMASMTARHADGRIAVSCDVTFR